VRLPTGDVVAVGGIVNAGGGYLPAGDARITFDDELWNAGVSLGRA
jgi:hypothetical protein